MNARVRLLIPALLFAVACPIEAANWPGWRGRDGLGTCEETNLPLKWSVTENVRWKVPLPEPGNSTPAVWGDRIFVTQAVGDQRLVICFSRADGRQLWRAGAKGVAKEPTHDTNPYCSASPATDGERVYAWFGSAGLYCFDMDGRQVWHRDLGEHRHEWGYASGPVIHGDLCFLNFGPGRRVYLLAVDRRTGADVWRNEIDPVEVTLPRNDGFGSRPGGVVGSWSVPLIINYGGREELVMSYPEQVRSYDPKTGALLWFCRGLNPLIYSSTIFGQGVVVAMGGYSGSTVAVKAGGSGDVTDSHRLWHIAKDAGRIGSGVIKDGHIYILNTPGVAQCIELQSGKVVWQERLQGSGAVSGSWSSMVLAGDRIYVLNQNSDSIVLRAAPRFEVLGVNPLGDGRTNASIVPSNGQFFIRTHKHLWCIGAAGDEAGEK
jgi:outer membrane protein assembly factor BamB